MLPKNINLGAHYYLWYGRPTLPIIGGGVWNSGYTNNPLLGEYNSRDKEVIESHINWAKEAGVDFFAVNWNDTQSWDDITCRDYFLPKIENSRIKFCIHYDSSIALNILHKPRSYNFNEEYSIGKTKGEKFLEDFEYLAKSYFKHPNYLKINGKPVVIIYNVSAFRNVSEYLNKLEQNMKKEGIELFLIADVVYWAGIKLSKNNISYLWTNSPKNSFKVLVRALKRFFPKNYENDFSLSKYFRGITGYNMYATNRTDNFLKNIDNLYKKFSDYAKLKNLLFVPNIMPGYNDRSLKGFNRPILERKEGEFYKEFWKLAKKYLNPSLEMVLITSFNEWHEGTEIESSKKYGKKYIELTKLLK